MKEGKDIPLSTKLFVVGFALLALMGLMKGIELLLGIN